MLNSSQTRLPARLRRGYQCPGRRSLPTPTSPLPSPIPRRQLSPAGGPGGSRALTGLVGSGSRTRARGLSATARPPRPARRHLGSQARPRAASSRLNGVGREDGSPANRERRHHLRRPPNPRSVSSAEPRQETDVLPYPGSGPIETLKGKIASLKNQ